MTTMLSISGVMHFVTPKPFVAVVPRSLPGKEMLVAVSGVAELVCAGLVAAPKTRAIGGLASAALLVAVYPANISMAMRSRRQSRGFQLIAWMRLPMQFPLIAWALQIARESRPVSS
ncbi:hypothetical protein EH165_10015 [Nakamurella antarctica]|uniref:DoxX family protein n=2 Tax=Nakamurella antarctica TaxID=1902245 RepID=A0A3G8ZQN0_9ACTN|nr:hypothetical protein EH165_10015 [Nakamurella antarctica]